MITRCGWCGTEPLYVEYHDREWGAPVREDERLYEGLVLQGAQAGLSWYTILRKRENYRRAFEGFDAEKVARYSERDIARLMADPGIVRNRLKIASAIRNARAYLQVREKQGSFSDLLWRYTGGKPLHNRRVTLDDIPASTELSDAMSRDLKKLGFNFVGSTICYAFMQANGMVNDHLVSCFRYRELRRLR